jgi:hypothetical protein
MQSPIANVVSDQEAHHQVLQVCERSLSGLLPMLHAAANPDVVFQKTPHCVRDNLIDRLWVFGAYSKAGVLSPAIISGE